MTTTTARFYGKAKWSPATDSWRFDGKIVLAEATVLRLIDGTAIDGEWLLVYLGQTTSAWIDASSGSFPVARMVPTSSVMIALNT